MSSNRPGRRPASSLSEILPAPFGKVPDLSLQITYADALEAHEPSPAELKLAFQMLDALLLAAPFEEWDH
jgi:hypothetical protein